VPYTPISMVRKKKLAALTDPLNAHFDRIEGLRTLGFNPELIVNEFNRQMLEGPNNKIGCAAIGLWEILGHRHRGGSPDVTAVLSYDIKQEEILTGAPSVSSVSNARLNIFTGLRPEHIKFPTDRRNNAQVAIIDYPSLVYTNSRPGAREETETFLFSGAQELLRIAVGGRGADTLAATSGLDALHMSLALGNLVSLAVRDAQ
jgi:hypothetical protein